MIIKHLLTYLLFGEVVSTSVITDKLLFKSNIFQLQITQTVSIDNFNHDKNIRLKY